MSANQQREFQRCSWEGQQTSPTSPAFPSLPARLKQKRMQAISAALTRMIVSQIMTPPKKRSNISHTYAKREMIRQSRSPCKGAAADMHEGEGEQTSDAGLSWELTTARTTAIRTPTIKMTIQQRVTSTKNLSSLVASQTAWKGAGSSRCQRGKDPSRGSRPLPAGGACLEDVPHATVRGIRHGIQETVIKIWEAPVTDESGELYY